MDEINTATLGETPDAASPQGETPTLPTQAPGETPGTTTDPAKELADLKAALQKANKEAATHRHKAKELDDLKAQLEAEKLTTQQRLEKQLADLQNQYDVASRTAQERAIGYEVRLQAAQMGIVDPDAAARLLDWSQIDHDDEGTPTNVADLLQNLVKAKPYLAGKATAQPSGGATNPSRSQSAAPPALSWEALGRMSAQEYEARRGEIQAWMATNHLRR